jgi:hypothetical protein
MRCELCYPTGLTSFVKLWEAKSGRTGEATGMEFKKPQRHEGKMKRFWFANPCPPQNFEASPADQGDKLIVEGPSGESNLSGSTTTVLRHDSKNPEIPDVSSCVYKD